MSFCDNFGERWPILIILSPLHSAMNSGRSFYIICHITSNLLPHYLVKFDCITEQQLTSHSSQKCAKSFIFSKYLQECHELDDMSMPIHLQCYSMCSKYPSSANRHACVHATCQWMRRWRVVQCWVKRCRKLLRWCDVEWRQRHSENNEAKINLPNRNTCS